jgi:hypothetical protein
MTCVRSEDSPEYCATPNPEAPPREPSPPKPSLRLYVMDTLQWVLENLTRRKEEDGPGSRAKLLEAALLAREALWAVKGWSSKRCDDCRRNRKRADLVLNKFTDFAGPEFQKELPDKRQLELRDLVHDFDQEFSDMLDREHGIEPGSVRVRIAGRELKPRKHEDSAEQDRPTGQGGQQ